jgi:DNA-binding response OmpR family regulator
MAESFRPHLVVLDINMPGFDGYQVARRLREAHAGRAMVVLAMSALPVGMAKAQALAAGCDAYVQKPTEFGVLYEVIERYLNSTKA